MKAGRVYPEDKERAAMFYILAGCRDLRTQDVKAVYNFPERRLNFLPGEEGDLPELPGELSLCSSSRALLLLAVNLYSSSYASLSVSDTFRNLDKENTKLAIEAIRIRFT